MISWTSVVVKMETVVFFPETAQSEETPERMSDKEAASLME